jgi:hypothetical protein
MNFFYLYKPTDEEYAAVYSVAQTKKGINHPIVDYDDMHAGLAFIVRNSLNNGIVNFGHMSCNLPILEEDYLSIIYNSVVNNDGIYYVVPILKNE